MKYYVVADVHGFYTELHRALEEAGYFADTEPHKLIICGDILDRGEESVAMQQFCVDLLNKGDLILIRGNHEDLMLDMLNRYDYYKNKIYWGESHHYLNGTYDSAMQLAAMEEVDVFRDEKGFVNKVLNSPFCKTLIPASIDYFETKHYIFVHGWIPCQIIESKKGRRYQYEDNWRNDDWAAARWINGMDAWRQGIRVPGKTIVCGHYHTSYGHCKIEKIGSEFGSDADFSPFVQSGIVAIDGCTAHSKIVNCIVIED